MEKDIIPGSYKDVDISTYLVVESVWDNAQNAQTSDDVPSICQRLIAAKVAFVEFMENG